MLMVPPFYRFAPNVAALWANANTDPYFASVSLLAGNESGANGGTTFDDQSVNNLTLTGVGNTVWSNAAAPTGDTTTILLDGNGDSLDADANAVLNMGTGDMTWEMMVRFASIPVGYNIYLFDYVTGVNGNQFRIQVTGGLIYLVNVGTTIMSPAWVPSIDTWYYVAFNRSGTTFDLRVDGTSLGTASNSGSCGSSTLKLRIGRNGGTGNPTLGINGYFANFRITKGVARDISVVPSLPMPSA